MQPICSLVNGFKKLIPNIKNLDVDEQDIYLINYSTHSTGRDQYSDI